MEKREIHSHANFFRQINLEKSCLVIKRYFHGIIAKNSVISIAQCENCRNSRKTFVKAMVLPKKLLIWRNQGERASRFSTLCTFKRKTRSSFLEKKRIFRKINSLANKLFCKAVALTNFLSKSVRESAQFPHCVRVKMLKTSALKRSL